MYGSSHHDIISEVRENMVTIKDIARRAGVSFSTVSKALTGSPLVKPQTKERVLAIAREMGYQPNLAARSLVSRRTGAIGVVWPSIERAALSTLITGIHEQLEREGYSMLLSMGSPDSAIETFRRFQVDAILMFGDKEDQAAVRSAEPSQSQIPILIYGAAGYTPYSTVDVNRGQAIRLALRHLVELGHARIAYVGDTQSADPLQTVKIAAFLEESRILKRPSPPGWNPILPIEGLEFHHGYQAARSFLQWKKPPTAVITGGIDLTRGILRAANDRGVSVPRDLSIVSYDNLPQMETLEVPMTAVGAAIAEMTQTITRTVLELVEDPAARKTVFLEPKLVVRASTAQTASMR